MKRIYQVRRTVGAIIAVIFLMLLVVYHPDSWQPNMPRTDSRSEVLGVLDSLAIKGRAPKTNYARTQFGDGWRTTGGCDMRNVILYRDLTNVVTDAGCEVQSGTLHDPYTGTDISFVRGATTSSAVQIDHVVALGDAWQKGAQQLTAAEREDLANDPLELLAVDGKTNQQKSDGDAATWLPPNKPFRCQYVARQVAVKQKYRLWVTQAEKDTITNILSACPTQKMPSK